MYAALRIVQAQGGSEVVAIGRKDVLSIYLKAGLRPANRQIQSGAVTFELLTADVSALRQRADAYRRALDKLEPFIDWRLEVSFFETEGCYHGGAFFQAIGPRFESLQRRYRYQYACSKANGGTRRQFKDDKGHPKRCGAGAVPQGRVF